jgi:hypothetical protein
MEKGFEIRYLECNDPVYVRKLARCKLDLVRILGFSWDKNGTVIARDYIFLKERKSSIGNWIFVHHRIVSAAKRKEFVSDKMQYIVLRIRWCNIIVLNV